MIAQNGGKIDPSCASSEIEHHGVDLVSGQGTCGGQTRAKSHGTRERLALVSILCVSIVIGTVAQTDGVELGADGGALHESIAC